MVSPLHAGDTTNGPAELHGTPRLEVPVAMVAASRGGLGSGLSENWKRRTEVGVRTTSPRRHPRIPTSLSVRMSVWSGRRVRPRPRLRSSPLIGSPPPSPARGALYSLQIRARGQSRVDGAAMQPVWPASAAVQSEFALMALGRDPPTSCFYILEVRVNSPTRGYGCNGVSNAPVCGHDTYLLDSLRAVGPPCAVALASEGQGKSLSIVWNVWLHSICIRARTRLRRVHVRV